MDDASHTNQPSPGSTAEVHVRAARLGDIEAILTIATSWSPNGQLEEELSRTGFLVSDFDAAAYEKLITNSKFAYVAESDGVVVGFLLGYLGNQSEFMGDYTAMQVAEHLGPFVVCKQIAVARKSAARGIGGKLYRHLIAQLAPGQDLIAATVDDPPNVRSQAMHRALGFVPAFKVQHPDGRSRTVWRYAGRR